jgi:hypothetical protein
MGWQKLGLVYCANGETVWQRSHAFLPTPWLREDGTIRVFVAFLDDGRIGRIGYVDVDAQNPLKVLRVSEQPVLDVGCAGAFDDNGVTPMCIVPVGQKLRLYYTGWQLVQNVRYMLMTGVATSADGGDTFKRQSEVPVLDRCNSELTVRTAAHVRREAGRWRMWYIGGSGVITVNDKLVPTYDLRYLESKDGLRWGGPGRVLLRPEGNDEYGFGRPYLKPTQVGYEMVYSIRSRSRGYSLGHATSSDGLNWARLGELPLRPKSSAHDWDGNMQCFGAVQETADGRYLFYNGNDHGRTGFGVARWAS